MRSWLVFLVALLLAACAEMEVAPDAAPGPPLQRFSAEGRIALRQGEQLTHLRFRWDHAPESDAVLLMSPLGQGLAELARDASGARLMQANQPAITADSLAQLSQRVLGAPVPLEALADWLRGAHPTPSGEVEGWRVVISDTSAFRQRRLPRVLEARRDDLEFKLIVDDWDVPQ
jgi:outer membrane lipoprotein LolB